MTALMARLELQKLAAALELGEDQLGYLGDLSFDRMREVRELVTNALHSQHAHRFGRMAAVSKLVPAAVNARASTLVGPALSAQVAGALDPQHAVKLAKAMKPEFLADVSTYLDPGRVQDIVRALPTSVVVPVGKILLQRRAFLTLGRFTAVVDPEVALTATEDADGMDLLHLALYTEDRPAIDAIVTRIDDERIGQAMAAAAKAGEFEEALALMEVLSPTNRARVLEETVRLTDDERNDLLSAVIRTESWSVLLESLDKVSHDALKLIMNVPATTEAAVFDTVLEQAIKANRTEVFEAILLALDAAHVGVMSTSKVLKGKPFQEWVAKTPGLTERLSGVLSKVG